MINITTFFAKQNLHTKIKLSFLCFSVRKINIRHSIQIIEKDDNPMLLSDMIDLIYKNFGLQFVGFARGFPARDYLKSYNVTDKQTDLPKRTMKDSYTSALIPLASNVPLQDTFITKDKSVRIGKLLENMDIFSIRCIQKHIFNPDLKIEGINDPYMLITGLIDRIDFLDNNISALKDIRFRGHVSWVGKSSGEVLVNVEQTDDKGNWHQKARACFVLAARNPTNDRSAVINSLIAQNEHEELIMKEARERREKFSIIKESPPNVSKDEQEMLNQIFKRTVGKNSNVLAILPEGAVWMENAKISSILRCHPEHRNLYHTIHGGYLLRNACEQSSCLARMFSKQNGKVVNMINFKFLRPVHIGAMLQVNSSVVYTSKNYMQIHVYMETFCYGQKPEVCISCSFTYKVKDNVPEIIPKTYQESLIYLDGKRHFDYANVNFASIDSKL